MPKYFDVHSHLNATEYSEDINEVIKRLEETDTHTIVVGTDLESSKIAVELAEKHEEIYACVGVHPVDNKNEHYDISKYEKLVRHPRVVAVGECGMDFFHADKDTDYERQKKLFLDQVNFALKHDKPIMIHSRNAYENVLEILEPLKVVYGKKLRGNVHFFTGSVAVAQRLFDLWGGLQKLTQTNSGRKTGRPGTHNQDTNRQLLVRCACELGERVTHIPFRHLVR